MTPPGNLGMNRLHFIKETLDIGCNQPTFACKPTRYDDSLNDIVEEYILPGGVQQESRLQFSLMFILCETNQIIQYPCGRVPACKPELHNPDNSRTGRARPLKQTTIHERLARCLDIT